MIISIATCRAGLAFVALTTTFALAACGGDEKSSGGAEKAKYDGHALVEQASGPNAAARSGLIDSQVTFTLKGVPGYESFSAGVSGPFRYRKDASLPDYNLEVGARNYGMELTSVGGKSWVSLGSTGYPLPADVRRRLVRSSAKGANGMTRTLEQFGIAPWRWEKDWRVAGTERLDGVEVVHITTGAHYVRILRDSNTLLGLLTSLGLTRAIGLPREIGPEARRAIVHNVKSFQAGSWVGVKDKALRKSGFRMTFVVPKADRAKVAGISSGTVVGELNVTQVGKPQKISAPETIGPIADFKIGIEALGDAQDGKR